MICNKKKHKTLGLTLSRHINPLKINVNLIFFGITLKTINVDIANPILPKTIEIVPHL